MDNREAGEYDPNINNHPPTCTCAECTNRRLGKKKQAIWSNLRNYLPFKKLEPEKPSLPPAGPITRTTKAQKQALRWLLPAVLIFSCALIGFGISLFIGTAIPLWLLLGFSLIISIEKWFHYTTRKYKYIGKLYRLFLNLSMLCLLGLTIWSGIKLFSQLYFSSPLTGSLVFLAELAFFIWMWRTVSKNSWRWPSMKLTVFLLVCMAVVFTFAGVPPLSTYKDTLIIKWEDYQTEQAAQQAELEAKEAADHQRREAEQKAQEAARIEEERIAQEQAEQARKEAEAEVARIASLRNPSWSQLKSFLLKDDTDEMEYIYPVVVCADFADKLKRNAEEAGWRCAFVSVKLEGYPDWYDYGIPSNTEHACNAFETIDRGLIYIDCTRPALSGFSGNADKSVNVEIGKEYITTSIFPMAGWSSVWPSMGVVTEIVSIKW
ncbi:hypothetical protein ES707_01986 [subsurface metagenome]